MRIALSLLWKVFGIYSPAVVSAIWVYSAMQIVNNTPWFVCYVTLAIVWAGIFLDRWIKTD